MFCYYTIALVINNSPRRNKLEVRPELRLIGVNTKRYYITEQSNHDTSAAVNADKMVPKVSARGTYSCHCRTPIIRSTQNDIVRTRIKPTVLMRAVGDSIL